jgi:hypothetical protein
MRTERAFILSIILIFGIVSHGYAFGTERAELTADVIQSLTFNDIESTYDLGKGTQSICAARAKLWTDAHEYGSANDGSLSTSQFQADRQMDLLNNAAGRELSETYYDALEVSVIAGAQYYADTGVLKRIKTDAQNNYTYSQMQAISTWTLRSSNATGKV